MNIPEDLLYSKEHEWIRDENGIVVIGITTYAEQQLGDVVYVELPEIGRQLSAGDAFGTVESVKAVSELFAPVSGEVVEINETLTDAPEKVNEDPYGDAWMIKVRATDMDELGQLLDAEAYTQLTESED